MFFCSVSVCGESGAVENASRLLYSLPWSGEIISPPPLSLSRIPFCLFFAPFDFSFMMTLKGLLFFFFLKSGGLKKAAGEGVGVLALGGVRAQSFRAAHGGLGAICTSLSLFTCLSVHVGRQAEKSRLTTGCAG